MKTRTGTPSTNRPAQARATRQRARAGGGRGAGGGWPANVHVGVGAPRTHRPQARRGVQCVRALRSRGRSPGRFVPVGESVVGAAASRRASRREGRTQSAGGGAAPPGAGPTYQRRRISRDQLPGSARSTRSYGAVSHTRQQVQLIMAPHPGAEASCSPTISWA